MKRLFQSIDSTLPKTFLGIILLIQILSHLPFFHLQPSGQHVWRQTVGMSMARNYFEENSSFWYPKGDIRIEDSDEGYIYHEFPLIYWLTGMSYGLTGDHPVNSRVIVFIVCCLLIVAAYLLARALGLPAAQAKWYPWFVIMTPIFYYYSITMVPDLPALTWFVLGLGLMIPAIRKEHLSGAYLIGLLFLTLGTLSKPSLLFFGLPLAYVFVQQYLENKNPKIFLLAMASGLFLLAVNYATVTHALSLYQQAPVEQQVHTPMGPAESPQSFHDIWRNLEPAATKWFLELFVGFGAIPLFLYGLYLSVRSLGFGMTWQQKFWFYWALSFLIYSFFFVMRFADHDYYLTPLLPLAAALSLKGFFQFRQMRHGHLILSLLIILMPILMVARIYQRWTVHRQVPVELLRQSHEFTEIIPKDERILIIGDSSPIVYLYFIRRKGLVIPPNISAEEFQNYVAKGFRWLVLRSSLEDISHLNVTLDQTKSIGSFFIIPLGDQAAAF